MVELRRESEMGEGRGKGIESKNKSKRTIGKEINYFVIFRAKFKLKILI